MMLRFRKLLAACLLKLGFFWLNSILVSFSLACSLFPANYSNSDYIFDFFYIEDNGTGFRPYPVPPPAGTETRSSESRGSGRNLEPCSEVPQAASKARTQLRMRNFVPDNDFTELVCQNDKIVMQNHPDKIQEKDSSFFKMHNKFDRLRSVDSDVDELLHVLPGSGIGLNSQLEETTYPDAVLINFLIGQENISIENGQKFDVSSNECRALVVSSSSFGSGSSSSDKLYDSEITKKTKDRDGEECSKQNDNAHGNSVTSKKSGKRTRAAEVHNLSERRRRDRINEKMHALQELIPNCTKVDKATMLDEAIEYLKNLQLQVQMMYMNNGICVPQYSPMDIGMGYMYGMQMHPSQLLPPWQSMQFHRTLYGIRSEDAQMQMNDQAPNYTVNGSST